MGMPKALFDKHVDFKVSPYEVLMTVRSTIAKEPVSLTRPDVLAHLESLKVTFGIDTALIDKIIAQKIYDKPQPVVKGVPVIDGRDAYIEEVVKLDASIKPRKKIDGTVDYKNVDNLPQVRQGDPILIKHPRIVDKPGTDIYG